MSNMGNKEELLRRFIDGELTREDEIRVLHQIADDAEMREMLRFERSLFYNLRDYQSDALNIPDNFTDSVMQKIEAKTEQKVESEIIEETSVFERFKKILEEALAPRQISLRPAWVLAAGLVAYLAITLPDSQQMDSTLLTQVENAQTPQIVSQQEEKVWIRFIYFDDEAESVAVAGDFSNWEAVELNREMSGEGQIWTGMVQVTRGEQRYMFIKDDNEWVTDPLAEIQRDDGFGNKNAVIYL